MAHMIRGSGVMSSGSKPGSVSGNSTKNGNSGSGGTTGVVVGAVVNKPSQPYGVPANSATVAPAPSKSKQLAPGLLAVKANEINAATNSAPQSTHQKKNGRSNNSSSQINIAAQQPGCDMANTKEKTPMCLVNELARYNKIQHQYTLTDEQGPAHKKIFYVKLKLGDNEEYSSSGASIKKAQHSAAEIALQQTQLKKPPPKIGRHRPPVSPEQGDSVTPTVELNALAMRRGEPAVYRPIDMPRPAHSSYYHMSGGGVNNRYHSYSKFPRMFYVSLQVGTREFVGKGSTRQSARHNAAEEAMKILKTLPLPELPPVPEVQETPTPPPQKSNSGVGPDGDNLKSEISLVHEIALKRNLTVNFEVSRETGPPHMKNFVTKCVCGDISIEGEGNSKKLSKKRAAEKMLEKLQSLPPLPPSQIKLKRGPQNKKKNRNLVKLYNPDEIQKTAPDYGVGINPISRLIQIQQAKKEKEPLYSLITERGLPRRREFVIQVTVGEQTASGVGPNKKLAKRNAAEAMLQIMGYSRPSPQPAKPALKMGDASGSQTVVGSHGGSDKKVTFIDQETGHTRQLVPGVLLMPQDVRLQPGLGMVGINQHPPQAHYTPIPQQYAHTPQPHYLQPAGQQRAPVPAPATAPMIHPQTTAAIAQELLATGSSPTAESLHRPVMGSGDHGIEQVKPSQQLQYLADVLGFKIEYTDFPKGNNKSEYLSLVSLSTNPPQVSHGNALTLEESHDKAALTALKALSQMGLDTIKVKPNAIVPQQLPPPQDPMLRGAGGLPTQQQHHPGGDSRHNRMQKQ